METKKRAIINLNGNLSFVEPDLLKQFIILIDFWSQLKLIPLFKLSASWFCLSNDS